MNKEEQNKFEPRENRFFAQLPPVLVAAAAIVLILLVNAGASPQAAAPPAVPSESGRGLTPIDAVPPDAKPGPRPSVANRLPAQGRAA